MRMRMAGTRQSLRKPAFMPPPVRSGCPDIAVLCTPAPSRRLGPAACWSHGTAASSAPEAHRGRRPREGI
eukprot:11442819-Alexandrium_andersonii.AAC.1